MYSHLPRFNSRGYWELFGGRRAGTRKNGLQCADPKENHGEMFLLRNLIRRKKMS